MPIGYMTSSSLIEAVKRKASIPTSQNLFSDDDILEFADEELRIGIVPAVIDFHEEYFVYKLNVDLQGNTSHYRIPYRAVGGKLRDVFFQDSQGNLREMTRISPDDRSYYQASTVTNFYDAYYVEGEDIVLMPNVGPSPTGSLVFTFYFRPNTLVSEKRIGIIQSIVDNGDNTTTFTLSNFPTNFSDSNFNIAINAFDILQAKPNHRTKQFDILAISIDAIAKTVIFDNSDLPTSTIAPEVGDHLALAGECMIPQIPSDLHAVLAQRVVARCLEAMGDQAGLQAANTKLAEMEVKTGTLVDNRVEGATLKVNNLHGLLKNARIRRRGWWM